MQRSITSYDFHGDVGLDEEYVELPDLHQGHGAGSGGRRPMSSSRIQRPNRPSPTTRCYLGVGFQADDNPFAVSDPINKQYYNRLWRREPPRPQKPIYRQGRLGSPWRHVKACINNAGNHLVFIDGSIKSEENYFYPPETMFEPPNFSPYASPRLAPTNWRCPATTVTPVRRGTLTKETPFYIRAKQGFKYWPHEQKPIDCYTHY